MKRFFLITIDTEGDNCWAVKDINRQVSTENAKYLPRFQELCEKYGFIPTYLTNYEMARSDEMVDLGRYGLKKKTLEIGTHIHAWNQPPFFTIIKRPFDRGKPYLGEYPSYVIYEKLKNITYLLQDTFQSEITSFRSGRWYMDAAIVRSLEKLGYLVDCSCTPNINWNDTLGWTIGSKGTNWSGWPNRVCRFEIIGNHGPRSSSLIEVPVSTLKRCNDSKVLWLRPMGDNLDDMKIIVNHSIRTGADYVEFMIHSSELMPHGSKKIFCRTQIEKVYEDIEEIFAYAKDKGFVGSGLSEYGRKHLGY